MTLTLQIENFSVLDDGGPVSIIVPEAGMQVGRNAGMGWVLPDASRHISGHHFDVYCQGNIWLLHDRSTNGTFLHGHRHRIDGPHRLHHGDRFQVGQYIIVALIDAPMAQPGMYSGSLPVYDVGTPAPNMSGGDDPWAVPGGFSPVDPMPAQRASQMADFASDFVAFPVESRAPAVPGPVPPQIQPLPDRDPAPVAPAGAALPAGLPEISMPPQLGSAGVSQPPLPHPAPHISLPPASVVSAPPVLSQPPVAGGSAEISAPPIAVAGAPAAAVAPLPAARPAAFALAFCRGAGLPPELAEGIDGEALAERLGEAMAVTTARLMAALRDRSAARHFTRSGERTMRGASDNNPLKFLPSPEQALEASFLRPRAGFMAGAKGYDDALGDMARHQAALFAALQPALADLVQDLDPSRIESEVKGGMAGLAGQRKSRAWDAYVERWDAKAAHDNGILDEFIRLFAEAYRAADESGGATP
ncbi:MAG: type VI secretion system-associated FHA domain protein TagH [Paracoccus sp. (in: a-proteobacteria)]